MAKVNTLSMGQAPWGYRWWFGQQRALPIAARWEGSDALSASPALAFAPHPPMELDVSQKRRKPKARD
ncbi:hypothetical protein SMCB_2307 [Serpentinimonas maccroryi]|uniref:Uncharacterized protein n=1 Tax=Serpentinimonas maccroryi TaxID=1458426 RepID=A0A060NT58_9BURK|nr:hypothetical protein SMCB_2307 [Serpentinimonas maccroryi]